MAKRGRDPLSVCASHLPYFAGGYRFVEVVNWLVALLNALPSDHIVPMIGTKCLLDWVCKDLQGVRLHKLQFVVAR